MAVVGQWTRTYIWLVISASRIIIIRTYLSDLGLKHILIAYLTTVYTSHRHIWAATEVSTEADCLLEIYSQMHM